MANNVVSYNNRTFSEIKADLVSLIRESYPEIISDFNDAAIGSVLLDINAGIGNNLSINTDRVFQETQREYAQQRENLIAIARTLNFNIPNKRPSVTVVDFSVNVPPKGDKPDSDYYPVLAAGAQVMGGGKTFETTDVVDWNSPYSTLGGNNRKVVPNLDANGIIQSYKVTKREIVINGTTNIYKLVINDVDIVPFYSILLPDPDVIDVTSIILLPGTNYSASPDDSEFYNEDNRYYEVDYLAEQRVFLEDNSYGSSADSIKAGKWKYITKKFVKEFTSNNYCKLIFGNGDTETVSFKTLMEGAGVNNQYFLNNYLNNTALGEKLKKDYTLFIKYRTGGGSGSNVGTGALTQKGNYKLTVSGPLQDLNTKVNRSLAVNNPIPAIGGNDGLSIEEIRNLIAYNNSAQNRCVTINDYLTKVYTMPGRFGSPFKLNAFKEHNKVVIPILSVDENGNLTNTSNSILKDNICEYLSKYRMINDYIEIRDGRIFNLAYNITVYSENVVETALANKIISTVKDFHDVNKFMMGDDIFISTLANKINEINGVVNVIDIKVYNKVGGNYSLNPIEQALVSETTGQIELINNSIYAASDAMFEIKYPTKDITVIIKKRNTLF